MEYERLDGGGLEARLRVGTADVLILRATAIKRAPTGVHATVSIGLNKAKIVSDYFNVERMKERTHLANAAYAAMNGVSAVYTKKQLTSDLMVFCVGDADAEGLWRAHIGAQVGRRLKGESTPTVLDYTLKPYVLKGGGTLLYSAPESLKSMSALLFAVSVDAGVNKFWEVEQMTVLYINLERSAKSIRRRLARVNIALGLPPDRPLLIMNERGKTLANVFEGAKRTVDDERVGLVFLDSLSRAGAGDLKDNEPANATMDMMNALCGTWVVVAHTPRGDRSHVFGSQMYDAAGDVMVRMYDERDELNDPIMRGISRGIGFTSHGNDVPNSPLEVWAFDFDPLYGLAGVRRSDLKEFPQLLGQTAAEGRTDEQRVLDQIEAHGPQSQKTVRDAFEWDQTRASRAFAALSRDERIVLDHKDGNEQFFTLNIPKESGIST